MITPVAQTLPPLSNWSISCDIFPPYTTWIMTFLNTMYSLIICKISSTFLGVKWLFLSRMYRFVSLGCFGNERPNCASILAKKSMLLFREMGREKIFFFIFHIDWLNFTLHWHIWGDAPWNQSNSGISEEQYFETSWDMWTYYFLYLWTDYTIMWQLQRWNCGDDMFSSLVNWSLTGLWTETIEQISNELRTGMSSFCKLNFFFHAES